MRFNFRKRLDYATSQTRGDVDAFVRWMGRAFGFVEPPVTLGRDVDKLVPWLYREFTRSPKIKATQVLPIRDWWLAIRVDLGRMTFAEADVAQKAWHRQLALDRKRAEIAVKLRGSVVLAFEDGSAWHKVTMGTTDRKIKAMLRKVGESLGHCYAKPDVLNNYLSTNNFFVLYDRRGEPHVTIAANDAGKIADAKITGDIDIPPDCRWVAHVVALVESAPLRWFTLLHLASVEVLERLSSDSDELVRWHVANNTNTPPTILIKLSSDLNERVRQNVANNTNTPPATLIKLSSDPDEAVRQNVADNASTPPVALTKLANDSDELIRQYVALNTSTPPATLTKLAHDSSAEVRQYVALNTSTPPAILTKLSNDSVAGVRRCVALNTSTPPAILIKLSNDSDAVVRQNVANNTSTPPAILTKLARDPAKSVRRNVAGKYQKLSDSIAGEATVAEEEEALQRVLEGLKR